MLKEELEEMEMMIDEITLKLGEGGADKSIVSFVLLLLLHLAL